MSKVLRRTVLLVLLVAVAATTVGAVLWQRDADARRHYLDSHGWPAAGQAAYVLAAGPMQVSRHEQPAAIASLAKVMTAYLVLRADPMTTSPDFRLAVSAADVADTARRQARGESVVPLARGEVLTERQALTALLLPSANNVAIMLARKVAGSVPAFVARMNTAAAALGMTATHYTDPSGYLDSTVSTAHDQVLMADAAMRIPAFATTVATAEARLPVAGVVHNTDQLLGQDGFVGIKTGSTDAAGGCFMFRVRRIVAGRAAEVTGVVLGQPGDNLVVTGQYAARQFADHILSRSTARAGRIATS